MNVDVAYVGPEGTALITVDVAEGASVGDAVTTSRIVERLGLFEAALSYAIHGQRAERTTALRAGDRVELLRPLEIDPKAVRRARAAARPLAPTVPRPRRGR